MGATVGSLLVDMALNTASFASDLGKAKGAVDSWAASHNQALAGVVNAWRGVTKEMSGFIEETFSLKTALLALVGGGVIGELVKSNLEVATALVHHADAIGITTDALQEYQYVAKMSGVSTETLTGSLEKFGKQMGNLQSDQGTLYTYLQKTNTGLLAQVQSAGSVDQALDILLKTMASYDNEQSRLALASAAFGKGGLEMVNMVRDGAASFEELKQKAIDLGIVVNGDLLRGAQAAQEQMETLGMVLKSKVMTAVISNSAEIENFATAIINAIPHIIEFGNDVINVSSYLIDFFSKNLLMADEDLVKIGATATIAGMSIASMFKGGPDSQAILDYTNKANAEITALEQRIQNIQNKGNQQYGPAYQAPPRQFGDTDTKGLVDDIKAQSAAADDADAAYKKLEAQAKKTFESTRTPLEKYNEARATLNQELEAGLIDQDTYNRAIIAAGDAMDKAQDKGSLFFDLMNKGIHGNITSWQSLGQAVLGYAQNVLTALATGQSTSQFSALGAAGGGIGALLSGFGGQSSSFIGPPQQSIFSQAGSWISSFFHSGGIVGSSGGASRRVDSSVFSGAQRFHSGGLVGGEVPAILQQGEQVLTKEQQRNAGKGDTYYIDARGADSGVEQRLTSLIKSLSNSVEGRSVAAVQQARFRNPQLFGGAA